MQTKTKRLYETQSHLRTFKAVVEQVQSRGDGYGIILDQTAFFPEGGGQLADTGTLDGVRVQDVQEIDGEIVHITDAPLSEGSEAEGILDYAERFSRMQQHTGEHIVSGLVDRLHGYQNVGFHLGSELVTMDFNGILTEADLRKVERLANEAVTENLPVEVSYPSREALETLVYRSKIEIDGLVRIVTIPGYDRCACCAPHVQRTGEVGMVKLTGVQKYKGGVRVSMLCGFRALADYNQKEKSVTDISVLLSAKSEKTAAAVKRVKDEVFRLKGQLMEVQKELLAYKVREIPDDSTNICLFERELDAGAIRQLVNQLMDKCSGYCGVFAGSDDTGYRYVIGSKERDCREFSQQLNKAFSGKGGGQPQMVQGSLTGKKEEIKAYFT